MRTRLIGMVAAAALVTTGMAMTSSTAAAYDAPRCYGAIASDGVRPINNRLGEQIGQVELWYNSNTGENCVMTRNYLGRVATLNAVLRVEDGRTETVNGRWRFYSDGATLYARGQCVAYSGSINGGPTDTGSASRGLGNCG